MLNKLIVFIVFIVCFDEKEVRFVCANADHMHACVCAMNYLKIVKCVSS